MKTTTSFFLVAVLFSVSFFLMQGYAHDVPQAPAASIVSNGVTIAEETQGDGTLMETVQITKTPNFEYHGVFDFIGCLPDIVAPTITLSLGQKMVLNIHPQNSSVEDYADCFYFDQKKNDLSVVRPEIGTASFLERIWMEQPFVPHSWVKYYKIWTAEKTGSVVLLFVTTFTYGNANSGYWHYKLRLQLPVTVVDPREAATTAITIE
jgi:hypothetical protein